MATLFEDWCTADGDREELSGVVTLTPVAQQAAGALTLATVPQPISVTAGAFSAAVTPGEYFVDVELTAGADEVRISTDNATQRIVVDDVDTPQRLRDLIDLGVVGVSPLAKLNAIVTAWIETNASPTDVLLAGLLDDPESESKAALDATYAPLDLVVDGITYNPDGTVASSTEGGITTTYTWNTDGTCHTETRLGKVKTWTYDGAGNPISSTVTEA